MFSVHSLDGGFPPYLPLVPLVAVRAVTCRLVVPLAPPRAVEVPDPFYPSVSLPKDPPPSTSPRDRGVDGI